MSRRDCRECDGDGGCSACGGTGLGDYALDADDECPDCNGGGVCAWCDGRGYLDVADDVDGEAVPDTPEARSAAFTAGMAAGDAARALAIARTPFPGDWPEDARRPWGARRDLARMALHGGEGTA